MHPTSLHHSSPWRRCDVAQLSLGAGAGAQVTLSPASGLPIGDRTHPESYPRPMRIARDVAIVIAVLCLVFSAYSLTGSTKITTCVGSDCSTVDCGSPASPNELIDLASPDDA